MTGFFSKMLEQTSPHLESDHYEKDEAGRKIAGVMRVPIVTMPGIHPRAIAMSNSCGHWEYSSVAQAKKTGAGVGVTEGAPTQGADGKTYRDPDWERNMWWEDESNGDPTKWKQNTGNGWNQNQIMPIAPDPITGQQAFHSTVVKLTKLD